jgi:tetratricopeptide (TPR) repeat protein
MTSSNQDGQLDDAIEKGRYKSAYSISLKLMKERPDLPKYPLMAATALFHMGKRRDALKIVQKAVKRFPENMVLRLLQIPLEGSLEGSEKAEECCRETLKIIPPDAVDVKAQVLNYLGTALWDQRKKEEALEVWRDTIREFPAFAAVAENLREHTNQYGEPKSVHPVMDDLNHFSRIQVGRYFAERGQAEFRSESEVTHVYGAIHMTWNEQIAPRKEETERMTAAEKTALFESVRVDFARAVDTSGPLQGGLTEFRNSEESEVELSEDLVNELDSIFPFLPSGGGLLAMCAVPLIASCGLKERRFRALLDGKPPTDEEKDLLIWGVDVSGALLTSLVDRPGKSPDVSEALEIAMERLDERQAREAIGFVIDLLVEGFNVPGPGHKTGRKSTGRRS